MTLPAFHMTIRAGIFRGNQEPEAGCGAGGIGLGFSAGFSEFVVEPIGIDKTAIGNVVEGMKPDQISAVSLVGDLERAAKRGEHLAVGAERVGAEVVETDQGAQP